MTKISKFLLSLSLKKKWRHF